jgi:hypothetical protein
MDGAVWTAAPLLLDPLDPPAASSSRTGRGGGRNLHENGTRSVDGSATSSPGAATRLLPDLARRFWCELSNGNATDGLKPAKAGSYTAKVTVRFADGGDGGDGGAITATRGAARKPLVLALPVVVTEAVLPPAPVWLGYLGFTPTYPGAVWPAVAAKQAAELVPSVERLKRGHMTAVTGGLSGPVFLGRSPSNGSAIINFTAFDQSMTAALAAFPGVPVNSYGGGNIVGAAAAADLTDTARSLGAHLASKRWPVVYESIADEPVGDAIGTSNASSHAHASFLAKLGAFTCDSACQYHVRVQQKVQHLITRRAP